MTAKNFKTQHEEDDKTRHEEDNKTQHEKDRGNIVKPDTRSSFFYFTKKDKFAICDLEYCSKSENTFDMPFYALANNEKLLDKLLLYYMKGNFGVRYTYNSRAQWFCGYLAAFYPDGKGQYEKSRTNPTIRLLIEDAVLLAEVKNIVQGNI